jgi:hypothetical protein
MGGLVVGWLDSKGYLNKIPTIGNSRALTLGIAGYAATRFIKHPFVQTAGLAALAAAAFDFGKVHGSKGAAPKPAAAHGEDGAGAHDDFSSSRGDGGPY